MKKANIVAAIVGMLFSGYAFIVTFTFKQFKNVPVGPEFFPRYLAVGLFICSAVLLIQSICSKSTAKAPTLSLFDKGMQRLLLALALLVLYIISWNFIGFLIATPLLLFAVMFMLGMKKYGVMAVMAIGATAAIFFLFMLVLGIEMPLGFLEGLF